MSQSRSVSATVLGSHLGLVYAFLYIPILVLILLSPPLQLSQLLPVHTLVQGCWSQLLAAD